MLTPRKPMVGVLCCCVRARDHAGHAAAAPPSRLTNSRRLMPGMGAPSQVPPPIIAVGTAGRRRFDASGAYPAERSQVLGRT